MKAPEPPVAWRVEGRLLGTTKTHAIVESDALLSVEIASGNSVRAETAAADPVPSDERLLPRYGKEEGETVAVDRLVETPVFVGTDVVVIMRGTTEFLTSLVGLDPATLEQQWVLPLSYRLPVEPCATAGGVLLAPRAGEPAVFVDWEGKQKWLRELAGERESIGSIDCRADFVEVQVLGSKKSRSRVFAFDADNGDRKVLDQDALPSLSAEPAAVSAPVRQEGQHVVRVIERY